MKKVIKLLIICFSFFFLLNNVFSASPEDICYTGGHPIYQSESKYVKTGWNANVYVCEPDMSRCYDKSTACKFSGLIAAINSCKGTVVESGYKGDTNTYQTPMCELGQGCACYSCSVTCVRNVKDTWTIPGKCEWVEDQHGVLREECEEDRSDSEIYSVTDGPITLSYGTDAGECLTYDGESLNQWNWENKAKNDAFPNGCKNYDGTNGKLTATCTASYKLNYKVCACNRKIYEVKNVREAQYTTIGSFDNNGDGSKDIIPVYCINPGHLAPTVEGSSVVDFEVSNCASSYSTTDCGYANILIEGYYRRYIQGKDAYNYAVIGAAMRLWGAYNAQGGYQDTGIANVDDNNGWIRFFTGTDGKYPNVFKKTANYLLKDGIYFESGVSNIYAVDATSDGESRLKMVSCSKLGVGGLCGGNGQYIYALYLFANTVQGNPYMHQHLDEINLKNSNLVEEDIINNNPESATVDFSKDEKKVIISYRLQEGIQIDCSTLDEEKFNEAGCKVEQKIVIKKKNGEIINETIDAYDYCKKNFCYKVIELSYGKAICDLVEKVTIETEKYVECGDRSVKKYVSCSSSTDTQIMFSFEPEKCEVKTKEKETIETTLNCDACHNTVEEKMPSCSLTNNEDYVVRSVSDPSLNCILHKNAGDLTPSQNSKNYYDYSKMFGVNTDICRIYCSDKVTYYLAPKVSASSSLQFKYDIESRVFPTRNDTDKNINSLTDIIMVKRDCVSNIFYNSNFDYFFDNDKKTGYGIDNSFEINNWKDFYSAVLSSSSNDVVLNQNQLIYDLYSCNLFSDVEIQDETDNKINKPVDKNNVLSFINNIIQKTKETCVGNSCISGSISYAGGAKYIESANDNKYTGLDGTVPVISNDKKMNSNLNIRYCSKNECFRGSIVGNDFPEDYDNATTKSMYDTVSFGGANLDIPANDYVIFSYSMEADLYNSTIYQTEPYTGNVQVYKETDKDKYLILPENVYPVSSSLNNISGCSSIVSSSGERVYRCSVNHNFQIDIFNNSNSAFDRNLSNDTFLSKLNYANSYSCVYDVKKTGDSDSKIAYRNIDLETPIPHIREESNWYTGVEGSRTPYQKYVFEIIKRIKKSGESNLYATDEYLEYSYRLDSNSIEAIRKYNDDINSYWISSEHDGKTVDEYERKVCDDTQKTNCCEIIDGKYFNCPSAFLDILNNTENNKLNVEVLKGDGVSKYTYCSENPNSVNCEVE